MTAGKSVKMPLVEIVSQNGSPDSTAPLPTVTTPVSPKAPAPVSPKTPAKVVRKEGVSGRRAFAADICILHPGTVDNPCSKFGHLPGDGKGIVQPGVIRQFVVFFRILLKPLFWTALAFGAGSLLLGWFGGVLHFGGGLPVPHGSVPISGRPASHSSVSPGQSERPRVSARHTPGATHLPRVTR